MGARAAGETSPPVCFLWEGLFMYITPRAIHQIDITQEAQTYVDGAFSAEYQRRFLGPTHSRLQIGLSEDAIADAGRSDMLMASSIAVVANIGGALHRAAGYVSQMQQEFDHTRRQVLLSVEITSGCEMLNLSAETRDEAARWLLEPIQQSQPVIGYNNDYVAVPPGALVNLHSNNPLAGGLLYSLRNVSAKDWLSIRRSTGQIEGMAAREEHIAADCLLPSFGHGALRGYFLRVAQETNDYVLSFYRGGDLPAARYLNYEIIAPEAIVKLAPEPRLKIRRRISLDD